MNDQLETFLQHDQHSREILFLVDAMGLSFEKLSPALSKEAGALFGEFLLQANMDLARYLEGHIAETAKTINHVKNN